MNIAVNFLEPAKDAAPARQTSRGDAPAFDLSYADSDPGKGKDGKVTQENPKAVETIKAAEALPSQLLSAAELSLTSEDLVLPIETISDDTSNSIDLDLAAPLQSKPGFVSPSTLENFRDSEPTTDVLETATQDIKPIQRSDELTIAETRLANPASSQDSSIIAPSSATPPSLEAEVTSITTTALDAVQGSESSAQPNTIITAGNLSASDQIPATNISSTDRVSQDEIGSNTSPTPGNILNPETLTVAERDTENSADLDPKKSLDSTLTSSNRGVENLVKYEPGTQTTPANQSANIAITEAQATQNNHQAILPSDSSNVGRLETPARAIEPAFIAEAGASRRASNHSDAVAAARDADIQNLEASEAYEDVMDQLDDLRVSNTDRKQKLAVTTAFPQTVKTVGEFTSPFTAPSVNPADISQRVQQTINLSSLPPQSHPALQQAAEVLIKANMTQSGVSVRLDPPELGNVTIQFQFDSERAVTAIVRTDVAETQAILRERAEILVQTLKDNGFGHVDLSFEHGTDQQENNDTEKDFLAASKNPVTSETHEMASQSVNRNVRYGNGEKIDMKL